MSHKNPEGKRLKKKCLLFWLSRTSPNLEDLPCELVAGDGCIHEELLGLKFRISPHSFFQVSKNYFDQVSESQAFFFVCFDYLSHWGVCAPPAGEHRSCRGSLLGCGGVGAAGPGQHSAGCVLRDGDHRNLSGQGGNSCVEHRFIFGCVSMYLGEKILAKVSEE